jgi:ABC-2 type transport system permease protein
MSWLPFFTLWRREMVRFLRQRDRLMGALLTPVVFWWLLGAGLGKSFTMPGAPTGHGYLEFFFAGTIVMILLFTAIFSTISVIEDRREGFLQGVLVAPVGSTALVLGKVLGGTTLAVGQALLFLVFAPVIGLHLTLPGLAWLLLAMTLLGTALTALSFLMAWWMNSSQGYHAIMNLLLLPMWLLSGAVFPMSGASAVMRAIMLVNPVTYGVTAVRRGLYWQEPFTPADVTALLVTAVFAVVTLIAALIVTRRTTGSITR